MAKGKQPSLRQQLRANAEFTLAALIQEMRIAATKIVDGSPMLPNDLMAMCCKNQTDTLHDKLITQLANEAEGELLKMWSNQTDLPLGDKNAD